MIYVIKWILTDNRQIQKNHQSFLIHAMDLTSAVQIVTFNIGHALGGIKIMTDSKTPTGPVTKQKRVRHASAQATYMERKRAEGKEWLATWVPGDARDAFRALAKRSVEDDMTPSKSDVTSLEEAIGEKAPKWAKQNQTLLNIWAISQDGKTIEEKPVEQKKVKKEKKKKHKKK